MKFLIAASFLCLALVGQIQGGSLRGLEVRTPHQVYGAPRPEGEIRIEDTEDKDTIVIEKHEEPSPAMVAEVERIPFKLSLPHVDAHVNFYLPPKPEIHLEAGLPALPEAPAVSVDVSIPEVHNMYLPPATPSNEYLPPATPKPELPLLEPGLPTLPEAPVVPVIPEVQNTYLPPVEEIESTPAPVEIEEPHMPSEVYGPPPTPMVEEVKPSEVYGPPPTPEVVEQPEVVEIPELPAVPEIPVEEEKPSGYHYAPPVAAPAFELPKVMVPAPQPAVWAKEVKPQVLYRAPPAAKVHVESHFIDIPRVVKTETVKHKGYHYQVPTKDFPTPLAIPSLVSHSEFIQNHASSASSSSLHVNKYVVPSNLHVQPTITHDTVLSIHSGNAHKTSVGSFNHQVSVVSNELPHLSSFGAAW